MNDARAQSGVDTPASAPGVSPPTAASAPPDTPPSCPRCGYDLSGAAAAWNHAESASCPMRGTCSECGLEFAWGDVFNPTLGPSRHYFENAERLGLANAMRTWLWTLWPPLFWSRVGMRATRSPWRMLLWLGLVLVLQQAVFAATVLVVHVFAGRIVAPLPLGSSVSTARRIQWLEIDLLSPIVCNNVDWTSPWSGQSTLVYRALPGWRAWEGVVIPSCVALLVVPVMFGALPDSRRAGRLRKVHLLRATVFSLSWLATLGALRPLDVFAGWLIHGLRVGHNANSTVPHGIVFAYLAKHQIAFASGVLCWVLFWWWSGIRFGFKLRHGTLVWIALSLPAIVAWIIWISMLSEPFGDWLDRFINGLLRHFG